MHAVGKLFAIAAIVVLAVGVSPWPTSAPGQYDVYIKDRYYVFSLDYWTVCVGAIFAVFAVVYYWFPIFFRRSLSTQASHLHFWFSAVAAFGFLLLAPGLQLFSMSRDTAVPSQRAMIATLVTAGISIILFLTAQLIFVVSFFWSAVSGKKIGP